MPSDNRFNSTAAAEDFRIDCPRPSRLMRSQSWMRENLNIDLVFPIRDDVSAWLMCIKAELLYDARIINGNELNAVIERAASPFPRVKR
jgi:hypothetical protein